MGTVTDLKKEIDRLTFDLQQTCQEKIQAAEYGLAVLEEKQKIQDRYEELEKTFDSRNKELERAKEVCFFLSCLLFCHKKYSQRLCPVFCCLLSHHEHIAIF